MNLIVNGETKIFDENTTLQSVIDALHVEEKVMAAAAQIRAIIPSAIIDPKNTLLPSFSFLRHLAISGD